MGNITRRAALVGLHYSPLHRLLLRKPKLSVIPTRH